MDFLWLKYTARFLKIYVMKIRRYEKVAVAKKVNNEAIRFVWWIRGSALCVRLTYRVNFRWLPYRNKCNKYKQKYHGSSTWHEMCWTRDSRKSRISFLRASLSSAHRTFVPVRSFVGLDKLKLVKNESLLTFPFASLPLLWRDGERKKEREKARYARQRIFLSATKKMICLLMHLGRINNAFLARSLLSPLQYFWYPCRE